MTSYVCIYTRRYRILIMFRKPTKDDEMKKNAGQKRKGETVRERGAKRSLNIVNMFDKQKQKQLNETSDINIEPEIIEPENIHPTNMEPQNIEMELEKIETNNNFQAEEIERNNNTNNDNHFDNECIENMQYFDTRYVPKGNFQFPARIINNKNLRCQHQWFIKFPWLHYVTNHDKVLCHICASALSKGLLDNIFFVDQAKSFTTTTGFDHWEYALTKTKGFHKHELSNCHEQALNRLYKIPKSHTNIDILINEKHADTTKTNREYLIKVISSISYPARQGLALRTEDPNDSNFKELLLMRAEDDPKLTAWINKNYDAHR